MDRTSSVDFALRVREEVSAKLIVCSRELAAHFHEPTWSLESLRQELSGFSAEAYSAAVSQDEPVEIVFTSGTTAEPRGVVISHANILANLGPFEREIAHYRKYERIFHPIRFLTVLPLSHVFGQFLGIFIPQLIAGTVVFPESLNPAEILRAVRRERVSVLVAVPRVLQSLREKIERDVEVEGHFASQLERAGREHFLWRWWRFRKIHRRLGWKFWAVISGGAALDEATEEFWRRLGYAVIQGYGLTETTSLVSVSHPFKLSRRSIGKILPGREIKLDPSGEILVRGKNVASGYWQGRQLRPVGGDAEWFHTGDLGELDAEGNLYFRGRKKNVIVTPEGMNVYPDDLEAVLRREAGVRDCVVVPLERGGNAEPCAVLLLREGSSAEAIVNQANRNLAEHQKIRHWLVWPDEDFPRTATQKPRTNVIQQVANAQLAGGPASASVDTLSNLIARVTGHAEFEIPRDADLRDLNLTSLQRVELMCALEERYQVQLDEARFQGAKSVSEVQQLLRSSATASDDYEYPRWPQRWPMTWLRTAIYYVLVWPATRLMGKPKILGREKVAALRGPALIISNHVTAIDIGFIQAALPHRLRRRLAVAMSGEMLRAMRHPSPELPFYRRWYEQLQYLLVTALFNVFPLPQQAGFRRSFSFAGDLSNRGYSVVVFPEGRRTPDGKLQPFREGIGLLASGLRLPIIPLRIHGLFEAKQSGKKVVPAGAITVAIGDVVQVDEAAEPAEITVQLQNAIESL